MQAFSKPLAADTTQVNQLLQQGIKEQWTNPRRTLEYADKALMLSQELGYFRGEAMAHNLRGFCFWAFGDNDLAMQSAHDALASLHDIHDIHDISIEAKSYIIMARGYMDLRQKPQAHEAIKKSEQLVAHSADSTLLSDLYNLHGVIMYNDDDFDSALYYYKRAYAVSVTKSVDPIYLPRIISNIGEVYAKEDPEMGFKNFNEALALAKKTNNNIAYASISGIIGRAYLKQKDIKNAEANLQSALELANTLGLRRVMRSAYSALVDIRLMQGKGEEAVVYLRRYYAVQDSLINSSKIRQIVELEDRHALEMSAKNIELLEKENRIQMIWKNLFLGVAVLVIAAAVLIVRWQRYRYRKNRELLNLEIDYLTQQHKEAVDKYKKLQVPEPQENIVSADQRLLKQAIGIVEENIGDSQLGVEKMAELMNMSRTSLHRKIKSITGFPPSELIRSIRLRKAAKLIANKADSPTQVAHAVGFDDYSHFSKVFKKHFGVSPSEYPVTPLQEQV